MAIFTFIPRKRLFLVVVASVGTLALVGVALGIYFGVTGAKSELDPPNPIEPRPPSDIPMGNYRQAAVASNGYLCAKIGTDVLQEGGKAMDAALATLICEGVMCLQSMGLGGGFLMTVYDFQTKKAEALNARETAPGLATEDMFHGNSSLSQRGGLSIAVPGELRGYQAAYQKYGGGVPWSRLFEPTVQICRDGFKVTSYLAGVLQSNKDWILTYPGLKDILVNPDTGAILQEGELLKRPLLADTLENLSKGPDMVDDFYTGEMSKVVLEEIREAGGIITSQDLADYKVLWQEPVEASVGGHRMYNVPVPGSGIIVAFILNILNGFLPAKEDAINYHRITEAFKYGFGKRTELGDYSNPTFVPDSDYITNLVRNLTSPQYASDIRGRILDGETHQDPEYYGAVVSTPDDHGTAHVSVVAANGDAVSVTSTVNLILGSGVRGLKTGIIYNDEMDDFSAPNITNAFGVPPSPANYIRPGKRPLSSMCPAIFVEETTGQVSLVTGAAGGTKITTATALMAIFNLVFGKTIKEAIDEPRFHHQLFPMSIDYEFGVTSGYIEALEAIGHVTSRSMSAGSSVTGIARLKGNITACYDFRRSGSVSGY